MKKFLILLIVPILMASSAWAAGSPQSVIMTETTSDTAADSIRCDTSYTGVVDISDFTRIWCYARLASDTNWVGDTFWVCLQGAVGVGVDLCEWKTWKIDTFLTSDSAYVPFQLKRSDSSIGDYMRGMLIHWDSLEADAPGIDSFSYDDTFKLWIMGYER